jgi:hypothetical protein
MSVELGIPPKINGTMRMDNVVDATKIAIYGMKWPAGRI